MRFPLYLTAAIAFVACNDGDGDDTDMDTDMMDSYAFRTDAASAYTRVDRIGMPAVATALITSKDDYNESDPVNDGDFAGEIVANLTGIHAALDDDLAAFSLTPCDVDTCVAQGGPLIIPDTISIDFTQASGFPNGRELADPVVDITLAVALLDLSVHGADTFAGLPLNPPANDVNFITNFPFLAEPN